MHRLQHDLGNHSLHRLLHRHVTRAKLKIGEPGDRYEQEADRVADAVVRMQGPPTSPAQRRWPECEEETRRQPQTVEEKEEDEEVQAHSSPSPLPHGSSAPRPRAWLQRQGPEPHVPPPLWDKLYWQFSNYAKDLVSVNQKYPTITRKNWGGALSQLWSNLEAPGQQTDAELRALQIALADYKDLFNKEHDAGVLLFENLTKDYKAEKVDLSGSDLPEVVAARNTLETLYAMTEHRVVMTGGFLVGEDLAALHHMLENQTHIAMGIRIAEAERKRRTKLEAAFAEEEEVESPSTTEVIWDVVGWESAEDFASDVALTVLTGGIGKVFKWIRKGYKARKKALKLRRAAKLRKARKAKRLQRVAKGAARLVAAVPTVLKYEGLDYVFWVKKNWRRIALAYATDKLGGLAGGGDPKQKGLLERLSKETVHMYVERVLHGVGGSAGEGIGRKRETAQFRYALFGFAAGRSGLGRKQLRHYFAMNLKRRLMTNSVFYGLRVGAGETALSGSVIVDVSAATVGEMTEDFATQLIGPSAATARAIETARKAIQTAVAEWIKKGLK